MKIFSSFDTGFKKERVNFYRHKFGKDKVILISTSNVFLRFHIILPLIVSIILISSVIRAANYFISYPYGLIIGIAIAIIIFFSRDIHTLKKIIDHTMDFCIVTPEEIILVEQEGILTRSVKTLDTFKIKSIYINKTSLLNSIFDNGTVVFMSDGNERFGEIVFDHVYDPETAKEKIQNIIAPTIHNPEQAHQHNI